MTTTMTHLSHVRSALMMLLGAVIATNAVGCGPTAVKPISLYDSVIPLDARRFVADSEDGVSVARARLSDATLNQRNVEKWASYVLDDLAWPPDRNAASKLERLVEARVKMAEKELEFAETELELAEAKLDLVTAETAIRHDLAIYELEPLQDRTDQALADLGYLGKDIEGDQRKLEQITAEWWTAYSAFVKGGGESAPFYMSAMPGASTSVGGELAQD